MLASRLNEKKSEEDQVLTMVMFKKEKSIQRLIKCERKFKMTI
jgi:hypothetical protein